MTAEQFLQEVLASPNCPDLFEQKYREFQVYQDAALSTLKEFHRVCEQNGIHYQLAYGSLLGAIRDNGQIPWDYDIDVFVPFEEKFRLIEVLKKDLDDQFYFYCPEVNKECRHVIMRLAPKNYRTEALHVDVFYYVGVPNSPEERQQYIAKMKSVSNARFWKLIKPFEESAGKTKKFLSLWKQKIKYICVNLEKIQQEYDELCNMYPVAESEYVVSADSFADWYEFPKKLFAETELLNTGCGTFRIPKEYKKMLSIIYKDYEKVPSLEKRIDEMLSHYNYLRFFDKKV